MKQLYLTNSVFCRIAERIARAKAEQVNMDFPTGPFIIKNDIFREQLTVAKGMNSVQLRAPDDCKSWVGVFNNLEKITSDAFYFGFQIVAGDDEAASRYLQSADKFAFGPKFAQLQEDEALGPSPIHPVETSLQYRLSVVGGFLHVRHKVYGCQLSCIAARNKTIDSGVHCIICRFYFPFPEGNRSDVLNQWISSVGILRRKNNNEVTWAHKVSIYALLHNDYHIVGLKYDTNNREMTIHRIRHGLRERNNICPTTVTIKDVEGELMFAAEVTPKGMQVEQSLLSVRECNAEEWEMFCVHSTSDMPI